MLTLTRRIGERIRIGDDIEIVVVRVEDAKVRIGIAAPREIIILRSELVDDVLPEASYDLGGEG